MIPQETTLAKRRIVLLGIGHTNAHIVRMWRMKAIPDTELLCISDRPIATYSGMLPAALAGQIDRSDMEIDLVRLCRSVGAKLVVGRVEGLDAERRLLHVADRPSIHYDVLSIGIGSRPDTSKLQTTANDCSVPIKPMQTFLDRLREHIYRRTKRAATTDNSGPTEAFRVAVVGSGVAGLEITFCLPKFLKEYGISSFELHLVTRSHRILDGEQENTRRLVTQELRERGVVLHCKKAVARAEQERLIFGDGSELPVDLAIWATGATSPPLLGQLGLATDDRGFLLTDDHLQARIRTQAGDERLAPCVFAVGDSGSISNSPIPKAGVYAVCQGPILWENIQRSLQSKSLLPFRPQTSFLGLINLGDGRAIGQWKGRVFAGKWVYRLKHWIDSGFMRKFAPKSMASSEASPMQCNGCGCKLSSRSLNAAIKTVDSRQIAMPEDAAIVGSDGDLPILASTDFFTDPVYDAYLFGRLAAVHAASDLIACGARPSAALANIVLPAGNSAFQEALWTEFTAGATREFSALGAQIVGGHSIVGPRLEAGFTVIGRSSGVHPLRKSNLRAGDLLYLTKPLGIGVLLAAHMRAQCPAFSWDTMWNWMMTPQAPYAEVALRVGVKAATDITGFGLAGHLLEMLDTSQVAAEISLNAIPYIEDALQLSSTGIESSLFPENASCRDRIDISVGCHADEKLPLLFDPQTCGGLLFGVPHSLVESFLNAHDELSLARPHRIGHVTQRTADGKPLRISSE